MAESWCACGHAKDRHNPLPDGYDWCDSGPCGCEMFVPETHVSEADRG